MNNNVTKKIGVVIINYKDYKNLSKSIQSINNQKISKGRKINTFIIDQEYDEKETFLIKKTFPEINLIKEKENLGVGGAFNRGLKESINNGDNFFLLLPSDTILQKNAVEKLLNKLISDNKLGIVSGKLLFKTKPSKILFVSGKIDPRVHSSIHIGLNEIDKGQYDKLKSTDFLNCPILLKKEVIDKVGYFNPSYFMYYEDMDYYLRTRKKGFTLGVESSVISYTNPEKKEENPSTRRRDYYITRNLLFFNQHNYNLISQIIAYVYIFRELPSLMIDFFSKTQSKRAYFKLKGTLDFILNKSGKGDYNFS